jgi:hypothetical protein
MYNVYKTANEIHLKHGKNAPLQELQQYCCCFYCVYMYIFSLSLRNIEHNAILWNKLCITSTKQQMNWQGCIRARSLCFTCKYIYIYLLVSKKYLRKIYFIIFCYISQLHTPAVWTTLYRVKQRRIWMSINMLENTPEAW